MTCANRHTMCANWILNAQQEPWRQRGRAVGPSQWRLWRPCAWPAQGTCAGGCCLSVEPARIQALPPNTDHGYLAQITDPVAFQKMLADMKVKAEEQRWVGPVGLCTGVSRAPCLPACAVREPPLLCFSVRNAGCSVRWGACLQSQHRTVLGTRLTSRPACMRTATPGFLLQSGRPRGRNGKAMGTSPLPRKASKQRRA